MPIAPKLLITSVRCTIDFLNNDIFEVHSQTFIQKRVMSELLLTTRSYNVFQRPNFVRLQSFVIRFKPVSLKKLVFEKLDNTGLSKIYFATF